MAEPQSPKIEYLRSMTLSEVMHAHIPTLSPDSSFRDAVDKMDIYQFPGLVIVDKERAPVAVITEGDLARAVSAKGDATGLSNGKAIEFATKEPHVAEMDMEISEALHLMLSKGISLLPVVQEKTFAGVVLRVDLMQALLMDAASPLASE